MSDTILAPSALLTERQAADHLGVTVRTMLRWRQAGTGPRYLRVGHRVRYRPEALSEYVAGREYASTADELATTSAAA